MESFKKLIALEAKHPLPDKAINCMLDMGTEIRLSAYEPMIDAGEYNPHVYFVKDGLVRGTYMDKNVERTSGFARPGTLLISFHSYYAGEPSCYRFEACCPTTVVRINKADFDNLINTDHQFAIWVMSAHQNQLLYNESKTATLTGDAKTRLVQLTHRLEALLPETDPKMETEMQSHTSRVKRQLFGRWREIFKLVPAKVIASYLGITEQHLSKIKREIIIENRRQIAEKMEHNDQ